MFAKDLNAPQDAQFSEFSKATFDAFGQAAAVKLSAASSSLVADGQATDTITATVVDANGNPVANYNGTISFQGTGNGKDANHNYTPYVTTSSGAYIEGGSVDTSTNVETFNVVNGKATLTVVAPTSITGTSDSIQVNWTDPNGSTQNASTTVHYSTAQAQAFKLSTPSSLLSAGGSITVPIQVLDQAGNPVTLNQDYTVTATVTGDAYFPGNTQSQTFTFAGGQGSVTLDAPSYASGPVTLSVSGSISGGATLNSAATTLTVGEPGTAAKLAVNLPSNNPYLINGQISADNTSQTVDLSGTVEDANGFTTTKSAPSSVKYTITMGGSTVTTGTVPVTNGTFVVPFGGSTTTFGTAGTYTVTVSASGLASASQNVIVVPGQAAALTITPSVATSDVLASNPTTTVTAQLQDAEGNNVAQAGQTVDFYVTGPSGSQLNGGTTYTSASTPLAVTTNGNGQASVTLTLPTGVGNTATVTAMWNGHSQTTGTIKEVGLATTNVSVTPGQTTAYPAGTAAGNATTPMFTIKATDNYGDLANGDVLRVTLPQGLFGGADVASNFVGGTATPVAGSNNLEYDVTTAGQPITFYGATPQTVGNYTIKVQDLSAPTQPSGVANVAVTAGALQGFALFSNGTDLAQSGATAVSVPSDSTMSFTVSPVDAGGNIIPADAAYVVTLPTINGITWENTAGIPITSVTIAAGQTSATVVAANSAASAVTVGPSNATVTGAPDTTSVKVTGTTTLGTGSSTVFTVTTVNSSGQALPNETVYLSVPTSEGTLSAAQVVTNSQGQASFTYTAPASVGTYPITVRVGGGTADVSGLASTTTENVSVDPSGLGTITLDPTGASAAGYSTTVGYWLNGEFANATTSPLHAVDFTALNANGTPVAGGTVTVNAASGVEVASTEGGTPGSTATITVNSSGVGTVYVENTSTSGAIPTGTVSTPGSVASGTTLFSVAGVSGALAAATPTTVTTLANFAPGTLVSSGSISATSGATLAFGSGLQPASTSGTTNYFNFQVAEYEPGTTDLADVQVAIPSGGTAVGSLTVSGSTITLYNTSGSVITQGSATASASFENGTTAFSATKGYIFSIGEADSNATAAPAQPVTYTNDGYSRAGS